MLTEHKYMSFLEKEQMGVLKKNLMTTWVTTSHLKHRVHSLMKRECTFKDNWFQWRKNSHVALWFTLQYIDHYAIKKSST